MSLRILHKVTNKYLEFDWQEFEKDILNAKVL